VARNDRVVRVLRVAQILGDAKRGLPLKTLSERHGWPLRNLYRDIEALEAANFPVLRDGDRFRLAPGWMTAPDTMLTPDERLALFFARQLGSGVRQTTMGQALERVWQKLSGARAGSPMLIPPDADRMLGLRSPLAVDYGAHRRTIWTLETAIAEQRAVSCRYEALSTGELTARVVEPGVLHWDPALETLYFIGWCRLRDAVRVFAVHRFRMVTLTEEKTRTRPECSSQKVLSKAFRVWRGGNVQRVVVRLRGWAAADVRERRVHASQEVTRLGKGEVRVALEVAGFEEISRWILGFGALAVVESPVELVAAIAGELDRAIDGYEDESARQKVPRANTPRTEFET
jgi:predicted DNA-binding transcriptional regulator YafY